MTSLVLPAIFLVAYVGADFNLTILHTGNLVSKMWEHNPDGDVCTPKDEEANQCFGGMSRISTKVKEIRKLKPNTLLVDAGDLFDGGATLYHLFEGLAMADVMNHMGFDVMTPGENEFRRGVRTLANFLKNVTFPAVVSNADFDNTPIGWRHLVKKDVMEKFYHPKSDVVGMVGYIYPGASETGMTGKVIFYPEIKSVQKAVDKLRSRGINKIIALGHAGLTKDEELAQKVDGIDVIVGAHYHYHRRNEFFYTGKPPSTEKAVKPYPYVLKSASGEEVLIVQGYTKGKYLGNLNVVFDDHGRVVAYDGNPILIDQTVKKDPDTEAVVVKYLPKVKDHEETVIATTFVDFPDMRTICRKQECNFGNLVTDAMVESVMGLHEGIHWTHAPIAVCNSGSLHGDFRSYVPITRRDVNTAIPYYNPLVLVELTGEMLKTMLEISVDDYEQKSHGRFLQVSGLWVTYDIRRPPMSRVVNVDTRCSECSVPVRQPMGSKKKYTVIMGTFMAKGGDTYKMLKKLPQTALRHLVDTEVVGRYIEKKGRLYNGIEGRIKFLPQKSICDATSIYCLSLPHLMFLFVVIKILIA